MLPSLLPDSVCPVKESVVFKPAPLLPDTICPEPEVVEEIKLSPKVVFIETSRDCLPNVLQTLFNSFSCSGISSNC